MGIWPNRLEVERKAETLTPVILVVSTKFDPHADIIIQQLHERQIPFARFNTEDFPPNSSLTVLLEGTQHSEELTLPNNPQIKGSDITAVWYRRPAPFEFPSEFSPAAHVFAERETREAIRGLWELLDCLWVNHPERNRVAEIKLNQLKTAGCLGLEIPRTLVTNNPESVRKFFYACSGNIIIKCLGGSLATNGLDSTAIYTNIVKDDDLVEIENVRYTPVLLQEYVPKEVELRITAVGSKLFAAEIHSQTQPATRHDWRRDTLNLHHREHQLPHEIKKKCLALVEFFGLHFGAIDMILTPDGRYVFLEINPNGQWAWIEELTGLPISEAMIDLLTGKQGCR